MKMEFIFLKYFFFSFLIGIFISLLIVILILVFFTNNFCDKKSMQDIINLEKKYAESELKSANIRVTTLLSKYQALFNESIIFYKNIANDLLVDENSHQLEPNFIYSIVFVDIVSCFNKRFRPDRRALFIYDRHTTDWNIGSTNKDAEKQLIAVSHLIPNLDTLFYFSNPEAYTYYFYFEETGLYIAYPLLMQCKNDHYENLILYPIFYENICLDEDGNLYALYKPTFEKYFQNMMKCKTFTFDNNFKSNQNRTIFFNNYFYDKLSINELEFVMCTEFEDPVTKGKGYLCINSTYNDFIEPLDNINSKIKGYFFISNIGYNNVLYYPYSNTTCKIPTEYIFNFDSNYTLDEKSDFYYNIKKKFSSNYIDYIGDKELEEVYVNGKNSSEQYFYIDEELFNYSIYPIVLSNIKGEKEHAFSIIYIYNNRILLGSFNKINISLIFKIILEALIFLIFGFGLLYIIYSTFNNLSKNIVIPIKNANYMLKGINIGGENRLKYLDFLRNKQAESLEKLENIYLLESNKNKKGNKELINNNENDDNEYENLKEYFDENINYDKEYDEESNYIENENNFYNFDDQLLQFRSLEIEKLIQLLLDLKSAFILTSEDRKLNEIINYCFSDETFNKINNRQGSIICQSNIGNLQGQQMEYDKAIYHLALSLLDTKLQRFLNSNISDELDESDFLLNKLFYSFSKDIIKEKTNKLMEKQMNNSKDAYSQKDIGILINTRYCRLVHFYYIFFKNLHKLNKSNNNKIKEQFMNTTFHTINYYHKILIQYIFLSYVKNDLVKIGESILNYLEFLIKFKFKVSEEEKVVLKINNRNHSKFIDKQNYKKKIFDKIINWFILFDDYIYYVKDNSSLGDIKSFLDDYSKSLNSENNEYNLENQSILLFRINIQKYDFLKAKFCLACGNNIDALFYFIRASKKNSIVIDGLIKKKKFKTYL